MKASEAIKKLQKFIEQHGDLPLYLEFDAAVEDTNIAFEHESEEVRSRVFHPERIVIYHHG